MTREEINNRIEWLENRIFMNQMVDRWTARNYEIDTKYNKELRELKKQLEQ